MATGNKPVGGSFNDRFDMYTGGNGPDTLSSPAINVRKGFIPSPNVCANNAGKNGPAPGDYLTAQFNVNTGAVALTPAQANLPVSALKTSTTITVSGIIGTIQNGMSISTGTGATASTVGTVNGSPTGSTIPVKLTSAITGPTQLTFSWLTAPLPLDQNWTGICGGGTCLQGDGQWDCANYWKINHGATAYGGNGICSTPAATTASRYDVYTYENTQAADVPTAAPINDWSGIPQGVANASGAESGAPLCAISKGFTPVWDSTYDPRIMYAAIINCAAQDALGNIGGGNSGNGTPVAKFGKVFLVQPFNSDNQSYLYGEMTGLVDQLDGVVVLNQVQLNR
jgi:hypothetical protein